MTNFLLDIAEHVKQGLPSGKESLFALRFAAALNDNKKDLSRVQWKILHWATDQRYRLVARNRWAGPAIQPILGMLDAMAGGGSVRVWDAEEAENHVSASGAEAREKTTDRTEAWQAHFACQVAMGAASAIAWRLECPERTAGSAVYAMRNATWARELEERRANYARAGEKLIELLKMGTET